LDYPHSYFEYKTEEEEEDDSLENHKRMMTNNAEDDKVLASVAAASVHVGGALEHEPRQSRQFANDDSHPTSYILHAGCKKGHEGIGSKLHQLRKTIDLAERYDLRYVCQPTTSMLEGIRLETWVSSSVVKPALQ